MAAGVPICEASPAPALLGRECATKAAEKVEPFEKMVPASQSTLALSIEESSPTASGQRDNLLLRMVPGFAFIRMLYRKFGGYVPVAILQYGVNQGIGGSVGGFAMRYYMMDVLKLDGATMGRYSTAAHVPWNVKPCIGMLSDAVPLFGFHRTSYIAIGGVCGLVAYLCLGLVPLSALAAVPFMLLVNVSISVPDVIIDAKAAELSKDEPGHASDLQSLLWGVMAIGGLMSCSVKGPFLEWLKPQGVFLSMCVCSLSILIPSLLRWMPETRLPASRSCMFNGSALRKHPAVTALATYMSISTLCLSTLQIFVENKQVRGAATILSGITVAFGAYWALYRITPHLAKTALFIFLRQCIQPGLGEVMFVWMTKSPEGPKFSARTLGWIDCFGSIGLLVGVIVYNKYLTKVSYQKIFLFAQLAFFVSQMFDYVLVMRWNVKIGIPDFVFIVGDDTFTTIVSRFFSIPLFVLASKVCPEHLEATLFAMLMSLSNFGSSISSFLGVTMCEIWGLVGGNFDNLPQAVIMKSFFRLLPIPLIFLLVPNLSPCDPILIDDPTAKDASPQCKVGEGGEAVGCSPD